MKEINHLHRQAMDFAEQAFCAKHEGNIEHSRELFLKAMDLEIRVANTLKDDFDREPSRSVLYRSAASLALECGDHEKAIYLIAEGLRGKPPSEIADEMYNILNQINFNRHLEQWKIELEPEEFQFSLMGPLADSGYAPIKEFKDRIEYMETTIFRTFERKSGIAFRKSGPPKKEIRENLDILISAPAKGSLSATLRIGYKKEQKRIPGFDDVIPEIIDEIIECFNLFNNSDEAELHKRIPNELYFLNFIDLAKRIAPDGDKISSICLASKKSFNEIKKVVITRKKSFINKNIEIETEKEQDKLISVIGTLRYVDATKKRKGKIKLSDSKNGKRYIIDIPVHKLEDIVSPLWNKEVVVKGRLIKKNWIQLDEIEEVS